MSEVEATPAYRHERTTVRRFRCETITVSGPIHKERAGRLNAGAPAAQHRSGKALRRFSANSQLGDGVSCPKDSLRKLQACAELLHPLGYHLR